MRSSILSLLSLVTASPIAVLGDSKAYLETAKGEYLSYTTVSRGAMIGLVVDKESSATKALVNEKGLLEIEVDTSFVALTLTNLYGGPGNLSEVLFAYETPTTGFAFSKNGSLTLSQSGFHGFFACEEQDTGKQLYWAAKSTQAPKTCEAVSFAKAAA
ncbi:hypothetical protein BGW36DRAFT_365019 [Talaromyces proteolyticus]|uniref:DUF7907 domain-containing protein n=1 Tax=Talaromyces proteolyticus TaxID=1131652 RepID=A0AAD4KEW7_9EURO|nr:uncharacterized protein BGW36DRAFT_365019 [Talaromyces proteolyticus]KAH8690300.1 hypothetical protein BGW36DRAFT_365019 [Talaromyces proteolyticus]